MADSVMAVRCGASRRGAGARLRSAVTTVVRSVTVAAGVFAPEQRLGVLLAVMC